jgi:hypothetical protein
MGQKKQKKLNNLPGANLGTRQRSLCRVPDQGAPGKEIKKIKKILCRVPNGAALGKG